MGLKAKVAALESEIRGLKKKIRQLEVICKIAVKAAEHAKQKVDDAIDTGPKIKLVPDYKYENCEMWG